MDQKRYIKYGLPLKTLLLSIFICCSLYQGMAQNRSIDSLRRLLPSLNGVQRVDCLNELSNQYFPKHKMVHSLLPVVDTQAERFFNVDSSRYFASEAYQLALKIAYAHGIAEALSYKADVEDLADNFSYEEKYAREALMWYQKTDDKKRLAETHFDLAWALYSSSQFKSSISHFDSAFAVYQSLKDTAYMTRVLGIAVQVYLEAGEYDKAFEVSREGLMLATRIKDNQMIKFHLASISDIYLSIGDTASAIAYRHKQSAGWDPKKHAGFFSFTYLLEKKYDSADFYLNLRDTTGLRSNRSYRFDLTFSANHYFYEKKYKIALDNFEKAYQLHLSANDPNQIMLALDGISRTYFALKNDTLALEYAKQCLALARQKKAKHVVRMNCYKIMYSVFDHFQKNDSAYYYFKLYISLKDSVLSNQIKGKLAAYLPEQKVELLEQQKQLQEMRIQRESIQRNALLAGILFFLVVAIILWRNNRYRQKAYSLLQRQKLEIEDQRTKVEKTLSNLRSTQAQLIQSEKMASLGELTAGIAHEIQNPLNFVNNFSEVNTELIKEIQDERRKTQDKRDEKLEDELLQDIVQNQEKINHHGKRASDIVKGMLQHSRSSSGVKEPTDINALADEYLRLAYHGLRAKDKSFNATMKTNFDESIGNINIVPQDIGRVILNLITNAFYATNEKRTTNNENYEPTVSVSTKKEGNKVLISVKDNGNGIRQRILDKIFQPFFTTKPTGQGTGLGLSLSYDITKAHGGELLVETKEGVGSEFIIQLPVFSHEK